MIKAEKINRKEAIRRVSGNIEKLKNGEHTLKSVFEISFSRPDFTFLNVTSHRGTDEITYGKARLFINSFAHYFKEKIDNYAKYVGIYLENSKEWIFSFYGLLEAGFVPVLLSTMNEISEVENVKNKLNIQYILAKKDLEMPGVTWVNPFEIRCLDKEEKLDNEFANEIVFLTSGTTGVPKIVFYNGEQVCNQIYNAQGALDDSKMISRCYKGHLKLLVILPFYHIFGLFAVLMWFSFFNVTFVLPKGINPRSIKQACENAKPSHIFAVPVFWESINALIKAKVDTDKKRKKLRKAFKISYFLQKHFGYYGTHLVRDYLFRKYLKAIFGTSIRFCISGGAFLDPETLKTMNLLGYSLVNGYGSTEIGITSLCYSDSIDKRLSSSIGKPFRLVEYKIENKVLFVKAPSSSKHYIDLDNDVRLNDEDWINTHDTVKVENEEYFLLGREDEIVIQSDGENLSLPLLEKQIFIPHANDFALVSNGNNISLIASFNKLIFVDTVIDELTHVSNSKIGKHINSIYYTNLVLPKANSIKIKRDALKDMLVNNKDAFMSLHTLKENKTVISDSFNKSIVEKVMGAFRKLFPEAEIKPTTHYYNDLGGDSLRYFILVSEIEEKIGSGLEINFENPPYSPQDFVDLIEKSNK